MSITVSLVILTYNRQLSVYTSLTANLASAGYPIYELIHVDNGSALGFVEAFADRFKPDIQICHKKNQGVSKGYNRGMLLATGNHIMITGCDRVMPDNWLAKMVDAANAIPETGVISCYSTPNEATRKGTMASRYCVKETRNGVNITRAMPFEARFHSRTLLHAVGLFREDFGLYGFEDCEWAGRVQRYTEREAMINYVLTDMPLAEHLEDNDFGPTDVESEAYREFKKRENDNPDTLIRMDMAQALDHYYNPYARFEPQPALQPKRYEEWCGDLRAMAGAIGFPLGESMSELRPYYGLGYPVNQAIHLALVQREAKAAKGKSDDRRPTTAKVKR